MFTALRHRLRAFAGFNVAKIADERRNSSCFVFFNVVEKHVPRLVLRHARNALKKFLLLLSIINLLTEASLHRSP